MRELADAASVASIAAAAPGFVSAPSSAWNTTMAWVPAWAGNVSWRRSRACWASVPGTSNLSSSPAPAIRPATVMITMAAIQAPSTSQRRRTEARPRR